MDAELGVLKDMIRVPSVSIRGRISPFITPRNLVALDLGLAGLADEHDVVVVQRLSAALLSGVDNPGATIFPAPSTKRRRTGAALVRVPSGAKT